MDPPAFQVIILGPTGGPKEDAVTGLLVRSTSRNWSKGSVVAVDAGTLLAGIVRILEGTSYSQDVAVADGPFKGLSPPHRTPQANAAYIFREVIASVLITHPHLDHLSGLAINTPIVEASSGPKTVAGLPSAISAMKNHMFNDIIWPNLSDEDGGAGLITYQRLVEGGNPRFGRGDSRGYVRACEGLVTKCLSISHGRCRQQFHAETGRHHRIGSAVFAGDSMVVPAARTLSIDQSDPNIYSPARSPHIGSSLAPTPAKDGGNWAAVESSAFFIQDEQTGREIIIFGDIEPDSVSLEPRNKRVWEIAAPKIASGCLRAIFIECSYNDAIDDEALYGHLCPRHLIAELKVLAAKVLEAKFSPEELEREQQQDRRRRGRSSKRKRQGSDTTNEPVSPHSTRQITTRLSKTRETSERSAESGRASASTQTPSGKNDTDSRKHSEQDAIMTEEFPEQVKTENGIVDCDDDDGESRPRSGSGSGQAVQWANPVSPLAGFKVYIIHVKDTLTDGPHPSERILQELRSQSDEAGLGCEFYVPSQGEGISI